ncbi:MAG: hypothetical protein QI199_03435, partial [Candidatus Korarchaeota archaeon]|nr:hypothetical protein [Candidatus Korarchaeota archaeon]
MVGHVISRSTPRRIMFVVLKGARVGMGDFYVVDHPWKGVPVFLRVREIQTINEEVDLGRTGLLASSSGLLSDYSSELEYVIVESEVLGYRDPESGRIRGLETPPSTLSPVRRPSRSDLISFLGSGNGRGLPVRIGRVKGTSVPFHLDLASVARGHMFVTGMTRSGKSVTEDTIVLLFNREKGKYFLGPIRKFVDPYLPRRARRGIVDMRGWGWETLTLGPGMRPEWRPIAGALRHVNDKEIYEIETATGRRIRVTEDHSLLVTPDGTSIIPVKPKTLMAMRSKYLIVPRGAPLPKPKSTSMYMDRLIGIALASGVPYFEGGVLVMDSSPADVRVACMEAGVDCEAMGRAAVRVRSELLMDAVAEGLASILNLPMSHQHFTGSFLYPLPSALKEYLYRRLLPYVNGKSVVMMESEDRVLASSILLSLIGVTTLEMCDRGLKLDPATAAMLRDKLEMPHMFVEEMDGALTLGDPRRETKVAEGVVQKGWVDLERVVRVERLYSRREFVYDLDVPGAQNFLANGIFAHNSSFVSSLISKSSQLHPRPSFLVLDRRGEYVGLAKRGASIYDYTAFLPKHGLARPSDVARRLGYRRGTLSYRLVLSAAEEVMSGGEEPDLQSLIMALRRVAREMKVKSSLVAEVEARLRRELPNLVAGGGGLDVVEEVMKNPLIIVDLSSDTRYEDQFYAVREMVRRLTNYAVSRRNEGDFALIVVIEEAQYLVPERGYTIVGDPYEAGAAQAIIEAISQAGGYNLGFVVVTQRPAYVSKSVISQTNTVAAFRLRNGNDQEAIMK